ncbi:hypothetical protein GCM10027293_18550 [Pontibacter aydingkolensis]
MAGSFLTYFTGMMGLGEFYPFANWKLFTQPLGSKNHYQEYRVYTLPIGDTAWQRQPVISGSESYTKDEYIYTLNSLTQHALADSAAFHTRLLTFVKYISPPASAYKIVQETYQPLEYVRNPQHYDTLTVIRF